MKNTHGGVLLWVNSEFKPDLKPETLYKATHLHGCFPRFSNCTNGAKFRKASHMVDITNKNIQGSYFYSEDTWTSRKPYDTLM